MDCHILKNKSRLTETVEEEVKEVLSSNAGPVKCEFGQMMLNDVMNARILKLLFILY